MESYLVRIYGREAGSSKPLFGVVIELDNNIEQPFINAEELWSILAKQIDACSVHQINHGG